MQRQDNLTFLQAIADRLLVEVTFDKRDGELVTRRCAPLDYGPYHRRKGDCYHFLSLEPGKKSHPMGLTEDQVVSIVVTDEQFEPSEIVTWAPEWHVPRNW